MIKFPKVRWKNMSEQRTDKIRILPESPLQGMAAEMTVYWPVHVYRVLVPACKVWSLNLLERTVLALLHYEGPDLAKLQHRMGLIDDDHRYLIRSIVDRLQGRGLLKDRLQLTQFGVEWLSEYVDREPDWKSATVYRECIGGRLMPIIDFDELRFSFEREMHLLMLQSSCDSVSPSSDELRRLVRKPMVDQDLRLDPRAVPVCQDKYAELMHLKVSVVIPDGCDDWMVLEPFTRTYSDSMKRSLQAWRDARENANKRLDDLLKSAVIRNRGGVIENRHATPPGGFNSRILNYPSLASHLRESQECLLNLVTPWNFNVKHGNEQRTHMARRWISSVYGGMEHLFAALLTPEQKKKALQYLPAADGIEQARIVKEYASRIGLPISAPYLNSFRFSHESLKMTSIETPNLFKILALLVAVAAEDHDHSFHRIKPFIYETLDGETIWSWLDTLFDLRNSGMHTDVNFIWGVDRVKLAQRQFEALVKQMLDGVAAESVYIEQNVPHIWNGRSSAAILVRMELGGQVEEELKFFLCNMEEELQEQSPRAIVEMTSSLELLFTGAIRCLRTMYPEIEVREKEDVQGLKGKVREIMHKYGYKSNKLPKSLNQVSLRMRSAAMWGRKSSLGALILSVIWWFDKTKLGDALLHPFCDKLPFLDELLVLRGHNEVNELLFDKLRYEAYRKNIYEMVHVIYDIQEV